MVCIDCYISNLQDQKQLILKVLRKAAADDSLNFCLLLFKVMLNVVLICVGVKRHVNLVGHLCRLPEKGRKEVEEIVEEMKERNREERGNGIKGKKEKK